MKIGEFLQKHMSEKQITQAELSRRSGIPASTISSIINRNNDRVAIENLLALCKVLECDIEEYITSIKGEKAQHLPAAFEKKYFALDAHGKKLVDTILDIEYDRCTAQPQRAVPVSARPTMIFTHMHRMKASAGYGYDLDNKDEWRDIKIYDCPEAHEADFAVEVDGDSMTVPDDPENSYVDGEIVFIKQAEEIPLGEVGLFLHDGKGYIKEAGKNRLISWNPDYDDISGESKVIGIVIGTMEVVK